MQAGTQIERLLEHGEHAEPAAPIESGAPHLTSDSSARLLTTCGSTRSVKSQIDRRTAHLVARGDDRPRRVTYVLDGGEAKADLAFDDREVSLRRVHVRQ